MTVDLLTAESAVAYRAPTSRPVKAEEAEHVEARSTTILGFWIYLMSDCLLFAALFATYFGAGTGSAGGPTGRALFALPYVLTETFCLLLSSFTYGMAMLALNKGRCSGVLGWLAVTFLLGLCFIRMEINEFHRMVGEGGGSGSERLPLILLRVGRDARSSRNQRPDLDGCDDGAGCPAGSERNEFHQANVLELVLAFSGYHLDRSVYRRLSDGDHVNEHHIQRQ